MQNYGDKDASIDIVTMEGIITISCARPKLEASTLFKKVLDSPSNYTPDGQPVYTLNINAEPEPIIAIGTMICKPSSEIAFDMYGGDTERFFDNILVLMNYFGLSPEIYGNGLQRLLVELRKKSNYNMIILGALENNLIPEQYIIPIIYTLKMNTLSNDDIQKLVQKYKANDFPPQKSGFVNVLGYELFEFGGDLSKIFIVPKTNDYACPLFMLDMRPIRRKNAIRGMRISFSINALTYAAIKNEVLLASQNEEEAMKTIEQFIQNAVLPNIYLFAYTYISLPNQITEYIVENPVLNEGPDNYPSNFSFSLIFTSKDFEGDHPKIIYYVKKYVDMHFILNNFYPQRQRNITREDYDITRSVLVPLKQTGWLG